MAVAETVNRIQVYLHEDPEKLAHTPALRRTGEPDDTRAEAIRGLRDLIRKGNDRVRLAACESIIQLKMVELRHDRPVYSNSADQVLERLEGPGSQPADDELDDDETDE